MLKLASITVADHVPLYKLGHNQCKFPVEENHAIPGHFLFCAEATRPGVPWCPFHSAKCYPPKERKHG